MGTFIIHFLPSFIIHCFPPSFASFLILLILLYYCYCLYLNQAGNLTHWLTAFERSLVDFSPLLSLPGDIKVGVIDYIIKIVGSALTFGLLLIALRRKFERKYTR